jgi:hypothetical protein
MSGDSGWRDRGDRLGTWQDRCEGCESLLSAVLKSNGCTMITRMGWDFSAVVMLCGGDAEVISFPVAPRHVPLVYLDFEIPDSDMWFGVRVSWTGFCTIDRGILQIFAARASRAADKREIHSSEYLSRRILLTVIRQALCPFASCLSRVCVQREERLGPARTKHSRSRGCSNRYLPAEWIPESHDWYRRWHNIHNTVIEPSNATPPRACTHHQLLPLRTRLAVHSRLFLHRSAALP